MERLVWFSSFSLMSCFSFYLDTKMNYNLRRNDYFVGKYLPTNSKATQQSGSKSKKRIRSNPTINEIKYRIINRLNFNRRSCKRAFTIEIKKSAAIHLKTRYGLTNSFRQYRCFDEYYNVYLLRNFFCNFKYWSIAKTVFKSEFLKNEKKNIFLKT